jgi:hypothetical protein
MRSKEDYLKFVQEIRTILASDAEAGCSCPKKKCEWHGDCYNCVRIHRHFGDHLPNCLQFILREKVKEIAGTVEMTVEPKEKTPPEYWDYVNRVDPPEKK